MVASCCQTFSKKKQQQKKRMKCHLAAKFVEKNSKLNYKTHRNFSNRSGQQQIQLTFNLVLLILIEQNKKPQHQKCILVLKIKFIINFQLFTSIKSHLHHHKMHYEVFFLFCYFASFLYVQHY